MVSNCGDGNTKTQGQLNKILCEPNGGKYMCEGSTVLENIVGFKE